MPNILIRTKPEKIEHKMKNKIGKGGWCWWTMSILPRRDVNNVLFTDGKKVFAEGKFRGTATDAETDKPCIEFEPLTRVDYPQPKVAPTRGFTYVD